MGEAAIVSLVFGLIDRAASYAAVLNKAKAEGRDVTEAEIDSIVADDDKARTAERDAIARARAREAKKA